MTKEQQIKEMAEAIRRTNVKLDVFDYLSTNKLKFETMADGLYNEGYRKQSDTIKEFAEKLQQVIDKAELVAQKMHNKYHLTFGAEQKAYSNAYNATVSIRECIENLKKNTEWRS